MRVTEKTMNDALLPQRCGTAATEFVFVLPLMMLIGFGCLDLGRAVQHYSLLSSAANAGAQCAATNRFFNPHTRDAWETKVRNTVRDELASLNATGTPLSEFEIRIETDHTNSRDGSNQNQSLRQIKVSVAHNLQTMFHWPGFAGGIPLYGETVIRQYR
jgi:hypothetical protein